MPKSGIDITANVQGIKKPLQDLNSIINRLERTMNSIAKTASFDNVAEGIKNVTNQVKGLLNYAVKLSDAYTKISANVLTKARVPGLKRPMILPTKIEVKVPTEEAKREKALREQEKAAQAAARAERQAALEAQRRTRLLDRVARVKQQILNAGYSESVVREKILRIESLEGTALDRYLTLASRAAQQKAKDYQLEKSILLLTEKEPRIKAKYADQLKNISHLTTRQKTQLLDNLRIEQAHLKVSDRFLAKIHGLGFGLIRLGSQMRQTGMMWTAAVAGLVRDSMRFNLQVIKMSAGLGISASQVEQLSVVAEATGVDLTQLTKGLGNYYQALLTAGQGTSLLSSQVRKAFKAVGIQATKLGQETENPIAVLNKMRKVFQQLRNASDRAYIGQKVFGQVYEDFIPLLSMSDQLFNEIKQAYTDFFAGLGVGAGNLGDVIIRINAYMAIFRLGFRKIGTELLIQVAPALQRFSKYLIDMFRLFNNLSPTVRRLASNFIFFGGPVLYAIGYIVSFIGNLGTLAQLIADLVVKIRAAAAATSLWGLAMKGAAFIFNPYTLAIIGLNAAIAGYIKSQVQFNDAVAKGNQAIRDAYTTMRNYKQLLKENAKVIEKSAKGPELAEKFDYAYKKIQELHHSLEELSAGGERTINEVKRILAARGEEVPKFFAPWGKYQEIFTNQIAEEIKGWETYGGSIIKQMYAQVPGFRAKGLAGVTVPAEVKIKGEDITKALDRIKKEAQETGMTLEKQIEVLKQVPPEIIKQYGNTEKVKQAWESNHSVMAAIQDCQEQINKATQDYNSLMQEISETVGNIPSEFSKMFSLMDKRNKVAKEMLQTEGGIEKIHELDAQMMELFSTETAETIEKVELRSIQTTRKSLLETKNLTEEQYKQLDELNRRELEIQKNQDDKMIAGTRFLLEQKKELLRQDILDREKLEEKRADKEYITETFRELAKEKIHYKTYQELLQLDLWYLGELDLLDKLAAEKERLRGEQSIQNNKEIADKKLSDAEEAFKERVKIIDREIDEDERLSEFKISLKLKEVEDYKRKNKLIEEATHLSAQEKEELLRDNQSRELAILQDYTEKNIKELQKRGLTWQEALSTTLWDLKLRFPELSAGINEIGQHLELLRNYVSPLEERFGIFIEEVKNKFQGLGEIIAEIAQTFVSSFASAFKDLIIGAKDFGDFFTAVIDSVRDAVLTMMGKMIAQWIMNFLLGRILGIKKSTTDIAAATASAMAWAIASQAVLGPLGLLTGPALAASYAGLIAATTTPVLAGALALPTFAEGGIVTEPTLLLAGEKGPEMIVPLTDYNAEQGKALVVNYNHYGDINTGVDQEALYNDITRVIINAKRGIA